MQDKKPDLLEVMEKYGVSAGGVMRRATKNPKILCPFHNEKTPSFVIYLDKQSWYCYGACGVGGDVYDFAGRMKFGHAWNPRDKQMFLEVVQELEGGSFQKVEPKPAVTPKEVVRDRYILELATRAYHTALMGKVGAKAREYLVDVRGLTMDTIRKFRIGYSEPGILTAVLRNQPSSILDRAIEASLVEIDEVTGSVKEYFRKRIILPDLERGGGVRYLQSRDVRDPVPEGALKYLGMRGEKTLFNGANVVRTLPIFLIESPMDVYTIAQALFQAEANMGTGMKREVVAFCKTQPILICIPNNDKNNAGEDAAREWKEELEHLRIARMKDFKDVNVVQQKMGTKAVREMLFTMLEEAGVKMGKQKATPKSS